MRPKTKTATQAKRTQSVRRTTRKPTLDDVWAAFLRFENLQEEQNRKFQEQVAEWNRRFEAESARREAERAEAEKRREAERVKREAEQAKRDKAFERRWAKLEGMFTSQWGKLVEQFINGDLVRVLNQRGIRVHRTSIRNGGCYNGQNYEFDIIACDGDTIVVVEVKTTLRPDDVRHFTEVMGHFRDYMPEYSGYKVQAAFGYLASDAQAAQMARKDGFWTIHATGGSAKIDNSADFVPRQF